MLEAHFKERRRYVRLNYHIPMRYRRIETGTQAFKGSLMRNISQGGAKMTIYEFLPLRLRLAVEIPLFSGLRPIEGVAKVNWINKSSSSEQYEVGLEFLNLFAGDKEKIGEFVESNSPELRQ